MGKKLYLQNVTCKIQLQQQRKKSFSNFKSKFSFSYQNPNISLFFSYFPRHCFVGNRKKKFSISYPIVHQKMNPFFFKHFKHFKLSREIHKFYATIFFCWFFYLFREREQQRLKKKWKICYNIFRLVI